MAILPSVVAARTGGDATGVAATSGGDKFLNDGSMFLLLTNGDSASHTVTAAFAGTPDGLAVTPRAVTVLAGKTEIIGPFPPGQYNDTGGFVNLTYSAVTSVTVSVVKCVPGT